MTAVGRTPVRTVASALALALALTAPAVGADALTLLAAADVVSGPPTCC